MGKYNQSQEPLRTTERTIGSGSIEINGIRYPTILLGDGTEYVRIDAATGALNIVDYAHHEVHGGSHYYAYVDATIQNTENIAIAVTTPDTTKWSHLLWVFNSSDVAIFDVLEDVTSFAGGSAFTPFNNDRNSSKTSGNTVLTGVTGVDAITPTGGTEIFEDTLKAGFKQGETGGRDSEIILKQNSNYLFRLTSGANSNTLSLVLEWYEHTNKN